MVTDITILASRLVERCQEMKPGPERDALKNDLIEIREICERNIILYGNEKKQNEL